MTDQQDHLARIADALIRLRYAVEEMGPGFDVISILIKDGHGGIAFDAKLMAGQSFVPGHSSTREVMGIKIQAMPRGG